MSLHSEFDDYFAAKSTMQSVSLNEGGSSEDSEAIKCRYATAYFGRSETYEAMGRADLAARDRAIIKRHGYTETTFCFMPEPAPPDEQ